MLTVKAKIGMSTRSTVSPDTFEECFNKEHFMTYTKNISYSFNSRGFRDLEWPDDLSDVIWCVGDSFTVGLGQPFEETWPKILEKKLGKRCINIGEAGCSNDMIQLRINEIKIKYDPKLIVVMWSYPWRRFVDGENVHYNKDDFGGEKDMQNFVRNYNLCKDDARILHSIIPTKWSVDMKETSTYAKMWTKVMEKKGVRDIIVFPQLDHARDYIHFDIKTSEHVVDLMIKKLNNIDNLSK